MANSKRYKIIAVIITLLWVFLQSCNTPTPETELLKRDEKIARLENKLLKVELELQRVERQSAERDTEILQIVSDLSRRALVIE